MFHNSACQALLDELERYGQLHDATASRHEDKLLNLDRNTAGLVSLLIALRAPRSVIEIGTSNGFSGIWIASALQRIGTDFRFITIERSAARAKEAIRNFRRANVEGSVCCLVGEAVDMIIQLEKEIDCVFFDGDRRTSHVQLELLLPRLSQRCLLMADNAVSHQGELMAYFHRIENEPGFQTTIVPIGKGLHVAIRT